MHYSFIVKHKSRRFFISSCLQKSVFFLNIALLGEAAARQQPFPPPPPPRGVPKASSHTIRHKITSTVDRAVLCNAYQFYDGTSRITEYISADTSLRNRNSPEVAFLRGDLHIVFGPVMTDYRQRRPLFPNL
jgi:hypothetical protein